MRNGTVIIASRLFYKNRKIKHFLPLAEIFGTHAAASINETEQVTESGLKDDQAGDSKSEKSNKVKIPLQNIYMEDTMGENKVESKHGATNLIKYDSFEQAASDQKNAQKLATHKDGEHKLAETEFNQNNITASEESLQKKSNHIDEEELFNCLINYEEQDHHNTETGFGDESKLLTKRSEPEVKAED